MAKKLSQAFKSLGTLQLEPGKWISFPVASTSGNDVLRAKFNYPSNAIVKGFAWIRCKYQLTSGTIVAESIKVHPGHEIAMIYYPIPSDLRLREITTRTFEGMRSDDRWHTMIPTSYNWSIALEELLN